jgi:hypothetical protein
MRAASSPGLRYRTMIMDDSAWLTAVTGRMAAAVIERCWLQAAELMARQPVYIARLVILKGDEH